MMQSGPLLSPYTKSIRLQVDEREHGYYAVKAVSASDDNVITTCELVGASFIFPV